MLVRYTRAARRREMFAWPSHRVLTDYGLCQPVSATPSFSARSHRPIGWPNSVCDVCAAYTIADVLDVHALDWHVKHGGDEVARHVVDLASVAGLRGVAEVDRAVRGDVSGEFGNGDHPPFAIAGDFDDEGRHKRPPGDAAQGRRVPRYKICQSSVVSLISTSRALRKPALRMCAFNCSPRRLFRYSARRIVQRRHRQSVRRGPQHRRRPRRGRLGAGDGDRVLRPGKPRVWPPRCAQMVAASPMSLLCGQNSSARGTPRMNVSIIASSVWRRWRFISTTSPPIARTPNGNRRACCRWASRSAVSLSWASALIRSSIWRPRGLGRREQQRIRLAGPAGQVDDSRSVFVLPDLGSATIEPSTSTPTGRSPRRLVTRDRSRSLALPIYRRLISRRAAYASGCVIDSYDLRQ